MCFPKPHNSWISTLTKQVTWIMLLLVQDFGNFNIWFFIARNSSNHWLPILKCFRNIITQIAVFSICSNGRLNTMKINILKLSKPIYDLSYFWSKFFNLIWGERDSSSFSQTGHIGRFKRGLGCSCWASSDLIVLVVINNYFREAEAGVAASAAFAVEVEDLVLWCYTRHSF